MQYTIGQAIIGCIDCNPPDLGMSSDFNIKYLSATFTKRGSGGGSPAVDVDGQVVALQCAKSAIGDIDHLLPMDLPKKVLQKLIANEVVARGTLQIKWKLVSLHKCRQLGLPRSLEQIFRKEFKKYHAIVADVVLPDGPAHGVIESGDILLKVNDEDLTEPIHLEEQVDFNVNKTVKLTYWRRDSQHEAELHVDDLHAITPNHLFNSGGAFFHQLSINQAMRFALPIRGVYCSRGSSLFTSNRLIESVNGSKTPDLIAFIAVLESIEDGTPITFRHKKLDDPSNLIIKTGYLSCWTPARSSHMRKKTRQGDLWVVSEERIEPLDLSSLSAEIPQPGSPQLDTLIASSDLAALAFDSISFCMVSFQSRLSIPVAPVAGGSSSIVKGYGFVLDSDEGLVIAPRLGTIPSSEILVTVTGGQNVMARVILLHHTIDLMMMKYKPSQLTKPTTAMYLAGGPSQPGEKMYSITFCCGKIAAVNPVNPVNSVKIKASLARCSPPRATYNNYKGNIGELHFSTIICDEPVEIKPSPSVCCRSPCVIVNYKGEIAAVQFSTTIGDGLLQSFPISFQYTRPSRDIKKK